MKINYFVMSLIVLDVCASLTYFLSKDVWRGIYWLCAAVLSLTTLFIKG